MRRRENLFASGQGQAPVVGEDLKRQDAKEGNRILNGDTADCAEISHQRLQRFSAISAVNPVRTFSQNLMRGSIAPGMRLR